MIAVELMTRDPALIPADDMVARGPGAVSTVRRITTVPIPQVAIEAVGLLPGSAA